MDNKLDDQILSWLEEISDFEDASTNIVDENVSDSDRSSHHSEHNTDIEQSADSDASNEKEPSPIVPSNITPIRRQRTSTSDIRSRSSATLVCRRKRRRTSRDDTSPTPTSSDDDEPLANLVRLRNTVLSPQASTSAQAQPLSVAPAPQRRPTRVPMYQGKDGTK